MQFLLAFASVALFFVEIASAAAVLRLPMRSRDESSFVQTDGTHFTLGGAKYTPVGANAYWIGLAGLSDEDMDRSFADIAGMGATTVRVWGFNEMAEHYTSSKGIYYQLWSGDQAVVNYSDSGLGYFDRVVKSARKHDLKLIVALTSNYNLDYVVGGIETYIKQILGPDEWHPHDVFFTNEKIKKAYKAYITAFVQRYKDETTIMSWELGHQLKCAVSWNPQNPVCDAPIITAWIKEMSSHVKSIDSNHLVAVGDEGFYNRKGNSKYIYNGRDGMDFEANIALRSIDYGTFAYRPASYELPTHSDQPMQWIAEHGRSQARARKPVVMIDLGSEIRPQWLDQIVTSRLAGTLYWQAGTDGIELNMPYWFRGDYVDPRSSVYALLKQHAAALKKQA